MSTAALILTVIIVITIYIYMRYASKKRRDAMNEIDTVRYYHENYLQSRSDKRRQTKHLDKDNGYRTYVTKYNSTEDYREYLLESFQRLSAMPEVFLCANDFVALDALAVLRDMGLSVPEDVWLCGFDDSPESKVVTPSLTTIHIHSQIMGFSAAQLLLSRIKEPSLNFRTMHTETTLIYRKSTGD